MKRYLQPMVLLACLVLLSLSCDRQRSNPFDPGTTSEDARLLPPQGLQAQGGIGIVRLVWQPIASRALAGFLVQRSERSNGGYRALPGEDGDSTITTGKTSFVDTLDAPGKTFFYRIAAVDTSGRRSEVTGFVGATVIEDKSPPAPPQSLSVQVDENTVGRLVINWSPPVTDLNGEELTGLEGFIILRSEAGGGSIVAVDTLGAEAREFIEEGLKGLTVYNYTMVAFDKNQNQSPQAPSVAVQTQGVSVIEVLQATSGVGRVTVQWVSSTDDGLKGYNVYRSRSSADGYVRLEGNEGAEVTTGRTTYIDSNLTAGDLFFYKVTIVTEQGEGERSTFDSGEVLPDEVPPLTPSNMVAVADEGIEPKITLTWSSPLIDQNGGELTGLEQYVIFRSKDSPNALVAIDTLGKDETRYEDTDLESATTYFYSVSALDAEGNTSIRSIAVNARTTGIASVVGLQIQEDIERIFLAWPPSADENLKGYNVYRSTRSDSGYVRLEGNEDSSFTTGQTAFTDSNLTGGDLFFYQVTAVTNDAESERSPFQSARVLDDETPPATPRELTLIRDEFEPRVNLTWSAPLTDENGRDLTGLASYILFRSKDVSTALVPLDTLAADQTEFTDADLEPATTYFYAIRSIDDNGNLSTLSPARSVQTPGVPQVTGLFAQGGIERINLQWSASGAEDLQGYNVYRSTRSDSGYVRLAGNEGSPFTTGRTAYIDSNLTAGDLFFYQVTARTPLGESERSVFVNAEVRDDEVAPATPSDLAVISHEFEPEVNLTWSAPLTDANGDELTGLESYVIFRAKNVSTALVPLDTLAADQTEFTDANLEPATTYFYAIRAEDDNGNRSPSSQLFSVVTPGVPQVSGLRAQGDIERIILSWNVSSAEDLRGYNLYRSSRSDTGYQRLNGVENTDFTTGQTTYIDSNLTAGQLLYYRVTAVTLQGESEQTPFRSAEVLEDDVSPATPGDLVAVADPAGAASITITWVAPVNDRDGSELTGLTSYVVFRSKDTPTPLLPVDTLDVSLTEFVDLDLEIATTYFYAIRAADDNNNESSRSITVSATTAGVAPPSGIAATSDIERISLQWNPSSDEGLIGYNVYRSGRSNGGFIRRQGNETVDFTTGRTTFIDSNLTGGDLFFYKIAIVTEEGEGVLSRFFDAEALPDTRAPAAPTFIDGEPVSENPDQLAITWNEPTTDLGGARLTGVSSYLIYRSLEREGVFELVGTATEPAFQDTGLDARTTYFYEIESVDLQGNVSPRSNPTPLTTGGVAVPSNITLTAIGTTGTSGSVTISWDTVQGVSVLFYEVQRTTVPGSTDNADYVNILPNSQNTSRVDNGVTQGQTFFYRVRARDTDQRVSEYSK